MQFITMFYHLHINRLSFYPKLVSFPISFQETITVAGNGELKIKIMNLKKLPLKGTFASDDSFDRTRFSQDSK